MYYLSIILIIIILFLFLILFMTRYDMIWVLNFPLKFYDEKKKLSLYVISNKWNFVPDFTLVKSKNSITYSDASTINSWKVGPPHRSSNPTLCDFEDKDELIILTSFDDLWDWGYLSLSVMFSILDCSTCCWDWLCLTKLGSLYTRPIVPTSEDKRNST